MKHIRFLIYFFRHHPAFWVMLLGFTLGGCAPFAPQTRTMADGLDLPPAYTATAGQTTQASGGEASLPRWWQGFASEELNALVEQGLGNSFDVHMATARLQAAQAQAAKTGAALWPEISGQGSLNTRRQSIKTSAGTSRIETTSDTINLGLGASYELDLWGRVRAEREASRKLAEAAWQDVHTARMSLAASLTDAWIQTVATKAEQEVLNAQVGINILIRDALATRFMHGGISALDVLQQQETLAASQAEGSLLAARLDSLHSQLAILSGLVPGTEAAVSTTRLPALPPLPPVGLPASLLEQRPDVQAAWLSLLATDNSLAAAKADRLPAVRLSADASYSGHADVLFDNWLGSLAASLSAPLFDGGRRAAEVERLEAVQKERLAQYGKAVANAIGEARDAIRNEQHQQEYLERVQEQLRFALLAREKARDSYLQGRDTFLRYLTEHKTVQSLERTLVREQAALLRYRVALNRALGGYVEPI